MAAKAILVLCAQALLVQIVLTQCINRGIDTRIGSPFGLPSRSRPFDGLDAWPARGLGCGPIIDITATSGGGLPVTSSSAIPPTGLSLVSENVYEGLLGVVGEVPFVGTAAVEGALPTAGAGAINYGCGNGVTAMVSEGLAPAAPGFGPGFGTGFGSGFGTGFGAGFGTAGIAPGIGCGCGRIL